MRHNPERAAAAYLGGELRRRQRERFEAHLLACDDCWGEVQAGRQGRALAESLREATPPHLRDRVRATVEVEVAAGKAHAGAARPGVRRWWHGAAGLGGVGVALGLVVAVAVAVTVLARGGAPARQPAAITTAVRSYQEGAAAWQPSRDLPPARLLGGLAWQRSGRGEVAGLPVVVFLYQDAAGDRVLLLRGARPFPQAAGARHTSSGTTWLAQVDGVAVFCADQPAPSLLLGADQAKVQAAAERLGLA
jgi:Putative zinc-finger